MLSSVPPIVLVPAAATPAQHEARSATVESLVRGVLQALLVDPDVAALQLITPLVLGGAVCVERARPATRDSAPTLHIAALALPAGDTGVGGTLLVSVTRREAIERLRVVPDLLSALLSAELSKLQAEATARDALEMASRDPATGLGNRRAWSHELRIETARAQRHHRPIAIIILDLDSLKLINDQHGHRAGDELIMRTAGLLMNARRASDTVCRLGGDEFGVLAPETSTEQAEALAERLRETLHREGISASVGVAASDCQDIEQLWMLADSDMYHDKHSRKGISTLNPPRRP